MNVLIVGVGLIGGSFSLALKGKGNFHFGGYDLNPASLSTARKLGIVDRIFSELNAGCKWADIIVLAIPVGAIKALLPDILDHLKPNQIVVDFGSTKGSICTVADKLVERPSFIAAHPIAGTEYSGPEAALKDLFEGKNLIICDPEKSDTGKLRTVEELAEAAGFYITKMSAAEHDRHLAFISHLSHITSYALSNAVLKKEEDGEVILDLAGSGFASTVRLAKSSPSMWSSIFLENKEMVLKGIKAYKKELESLERYIAANREEELKEYLSRAREIREILE